MPAIRIPPSVLAGFKAISNLEPQKAEKFSQYLQTQPVGANAENYYQFLSSELSVNNARDIVQTLLSFSELFEQDHANLDQLAKDLGESYVFALEGKEEVSGEQKQNLVNNLSVLFRNAENFRITLKAIDLVRQDYAIYTDARIVTDIRLVFRDELDALPRHAVVIHKLDIEFNQDGQAKSFSYALDLDDLNKLQKIISRAIKKEEIIKKDYRDKMEFLDLSN